MFNPGKDSALAIDLGADAVRLVCTYRRRGKVCIDSVAEQTLPEGPLTTLPDRHLEALSALLKTQRPKAKRALAALPTGLVLARTVRLDRAHGSTPEEQILWTLQNCLPFDPRDLLFDHWPVSEPQPGKPPEVMVVATQASVVQKYLEGFAQLKLQCVHLDVAPCALATLLEHGSQSPGSPKCTLVLSCGVGFFAVVESGRVIFWRPFDLAHSARGDQPAAVNISRIADEMAKCFSHVAAVMQLDQLGELLVYGNRVGDDELTTALHRQFHLPVRSPSPFEALAADACAPAVHQAADVHHATHYCAAVGLALQTGGGLIYG